MSLIYYDTFLFISRNSQYAGSSSTKTVTGSSVSGSSASGSSASGSSGAYVSGGSISGGSGVATSYDYEKKYEGSYSPGVSRTSSGSASRGSSSTSSGGTHGSVAASGWKLLDNGTYIRIYDARTTAKTSGAAAGSGSIRTGSGSADLDLSRSENIFVEKQAEFDQAKEGKIVAAQMQ